MGILARGHKGFTIIEVMLFLAVSGALAAGVLGGSSVAINNQRYVDAVNSFKALVQEEFINTTQVVNSRVGNPTCLADTGPSKPRGASECVIVGRLMSIDANGQITRSNITGEEPDSAALSGVTNDIAAIGLYRLTIDTSDQSVSEMSWGTSIKRGDANQPVSIIILRAPSGNVLSFVQPKAITLNSDLPTAANIATFANSQSKTICVDTSGWTVAQLQAIVIPAYTSTPSAVEQRQVNDGESECV